MSSGSQSISASAVNIRRATLDDAAASAKICYDAFTKISTDHGFPPDFPSSSIANQTLSMMFSHPGFYCIVAELDGRVIGSNCMDERGSIAGIGPITVAPSTQNRRVGRNLMQDVIERARKRNFAGIRLVQAAFHTRSLALYTSLGFDPRELLVCMQGSIVQKGIQGCAVRPAEGRDADQCNALCRRVHGHDAPESWPT